MNVVPTGQKAQQEPPAEITAPSSTSKELVTNIAAVARLHLEPPTLRSWGRCGIGLASSKLGPGTKATVRP